MHALFLAEFASSYVGCWSSLLAHRLAPARELAHSYWLASRFRHESWTTRLSAHRQAIKEEGVALRSRRWDEIVPVIEEVLISEPLARCIAYHAKRVELLGIDEDFAPLAHSVLAAHVEARHRCLHLIVFGSGLPVEVAVRLNRLRRDMETYNDMLLSAMPASENLDVYAFDSPTALRQQLELKNGQMNASQLAFFSQSAIRWLHSTLQGEVSLKCPNPRLNQRLHQAAMELLPCELFDSFGVPKPMHQSKFSTPSAESCGHTTSFTQSLAPPLNILLPPIRPQRTATESPDKRWQ